MHTYVYPAASFWEGWLHPARARKWLANLVVHWRNRVADPQPDSLVSPPLPSSPHTTLHKILESNYRHAPLLQSETDLLNGVRIYICRFWSTLYQTQLDLVQLCTKTEGIQVNAFNMFDSVIIVNIQKPRELMVDLYVWNFIACFCYYWVGKMTTGASCCVMIAIKATGLWIAQYGSTYILDFYAKRLLSFSCVILDH